MLKYFTSIVLLFIFDRLTKLYIINNPSQDGFFSLHINKSIAFSLPLPDLIFYPLIILILITLVSYWLRSFKQKDIFIWPWALVIIGAASNLIDRFNYDGVVDFINIPYFTVLNISDIYITIGVIWLLWHEVSESRSK